MRVSTGGPAWALAAAAVVALSVGVPAQSGEEGGIDRRIEALRRHYEEKLQEIRVSYEGRIATLEDEVGDLKGRLDDVDAERLDAVLERSINTLVGRQQRAGIAASGQVTVFDNAFNPAISVAGDFVLALSERDDGFADYDRFLLRSVELGFVGRVDPYAAYYVFVHMDEEEMELEEAYGIADDWLPDTLTLKFGRYNVDFGKLSPLHEHDLPFVDKPGAVQEYLGGSLRGTGLELHHWFPIGDAHLLRWSAGIVNGLDGDAHAVVGPLVGEHGHGEEEGADAFGERSLEDFAFTGRVTAVFELGAETTLQVGTSVAWAPGGRVFHAPAGARAGKGEVGSFDLETLLFGVDVTLRWLDEATGEGFELAGELILSDRELLLEEEHAEGASDEVLSSTALGFYVRTEYLFDRYWSVGVSFDWFEHVEDDGFDWWDVGAWVTWRIDEYNRLRLEARWVDDELAGEDYGVLMIQWTTLLGSHGHGIDW